MGDAEKLLRRLVIFCSLAFVGFAVASILLPEDRGSLQGSASAFLVGAVVSSVAGRLHAEVVNRLKRLERRVADVEARERLERRDSDVEASEGEADKPV